MIIGQEMANKKPYKIKKAAPIELTARSVLIFFIKKEEATKIIAT